MQSFAIVNKTSNNEFHKIKFIKFHLRLALGQQYLLKGNKISKFNLMFVDQPLTNLNPLYFHQVYTQIASSDT